MADDQNEFAFEEGSGITRPDEPSLVVDVDGFAGPLDLLLALARTQKVDLSRISILMLAEQYLLFVERARTLRLELAADYLVMAAWLAFLKSRLLLPDPPKEEGPSAAELAASLADRLRRLELIRTAAARLVTRDRLGQEVFARGMPEALDQPARPRYTATLYDLLSAYALQRQKTALSQVRFKAREVFSLAEARERLERMLGTLGDWTELDSFLIDWIVDPKMRATAKASSFAASLELVREGVIDVQQQEAFAPIWVRSRKTGATGEGG